MQAAIWPGKIAVEKPCFWPFALILMLIFIPIMLAMSIILIPIMWPCKVCEGRRIINRIKKANGLKMTGAK